MNRYNKDMVCSHPGCNNVVGPHGAKGMCPKHYCKHRAEARPDRCSIDGCGRTIRAKGLCAAHYEQMRCNGKITKPITSRVDGRKSHPLYPVYRSMIGRCYLKSATGYKHYGGRGIKVCDRWLRPDSGFWNFCDDMGDAPHGKTKKGYSAFSIDRIDVNGDYCPENCRWADVHTQAMNTRASRRVPCIQPRKLSNGGFAFHVSIIHNGKRFYAVKYSMREAILWRDEILKEIKELV